VFEPIGQVLASVYPIGATRVYPIGAIGRLASEYVGGMIHVRRDEALSAA
jgi:hypothetical protein